MIYEFTLENKAVFLLKPLSIEEIEEARLLCDDCVGENLYSKDEISATIDSEDKFFYLLKREDGETVGYIYYYLTEMKDIANYSKLDIELFDTVYSGTNRIGKIQSVGLKMSYRGIGLAAKMIQFVLLELKDKLIDAAFIVCWKPGGIVPLSKALSECHFKYLADAKRVWYDDTELICPYCKGRCLCDAEVYYKLLDGETNNEA